MHLVEMIFHTKLHNLNSNLKETIKHIRFIKKLHVFMTYAQAPPYVFVKQSKVIIFITGSGIFVFIIEPTQLQPYEGSINSIRLKSDNLI